MNQLREFILNLEDLFSVVQKGSKPLAIHSTYPYALYIKYSFKRTEQSTSQTIPKHCIVNTVPDAQNNPHHTLPDVIVMCKGCRVVIQVIQGGRVAFDSVLFHESHKFWLSQYEVVV